MSAMRYIADDVHTVVTIGGGRLIVMCGWHECLTTVHCMLLIRHMTAVCRACDCCVTAVCSHHTNHLVLPCDKIQSANTFLLSCHMTCTGMHHCMDCAAVDNCKP